MTLDSGTKWPQRTSFKVSASSVGLSDEVTKGS